MGGTLTPSLALLPASGSIDSPHALAFDLSGNLWVANQGNNTIVAFGTGQLVASGAPVPNLNLTVPSPYAGLSAMAFDNSGDLWVTCVTSSHLIVYTGDQLAMGTSAAPYEGIQTASGPASVALNPRPDGLPLGGLANSRIKTPVLKGLGKPLFARRAVVQRSRVGPCSRPNGDGAIAGARARQPITA